jgi:hypothetical protein
MNATSFEGFFLSKNDDDGDEKPKPLEERR